MGYIFGMTCNDIYIYCPKYYRINGKYTYHTKLPAINCKYDYFQVQYGNCNKFTFNISGNYTHHLKFTSVKHAYQLNTMCGKQSAFELVSIITIYFGVFTA